MASKEAISMMNQSASFVEDGSTRFLLLHGIFLNAIVLAVFIQDSQDTYGNKVLALCWIWCYWIPIALLRFPALRRKVISPYSTVPFAAFIAFILYMASQERTLVFAACGLILLSTIYVLGVRSPRGDLNRRHEGVSQ